MKLLRYTRKGWFSVLRFVTGTRDFRTGGMTPDKDGFYQRELLAGPFPTADEAIRLGWP